ncbi:MAG TPA: BlaI/MecI/CopY family transcriptional regulator [Solirubrobacteraceae bacterium]|nr:BlaI/MecI/CopY family transcriptional regulator [Solirubrobacteraceae bacterium]
MSAIPPSLHELELEVMEQLWRAGETSVRSVMDELNRDADKERAYTTYMTTMARLYRKGLLRRRREGKTDYYAPAYGRDEYMAMRARAEVDQVISQYGDLALSHFAEQMAELDPARRRALQRLARRR